MHPWREGTGVGTGWEIKYFGKFVKTYLRYLRHEGPKPLLSRALRLLFSHLFKYRREVFYSRSLENLSTSTVTPKAEIIFEEASITNLNELEKIMYVKPAQIRNWLLDKKRCFVVRVKENIVHYSWVSAREEYIPVIDKVIKMDDHEVCIHTCRTLTAYRGKGIFPFVLNSICQSLKNEGIHNVIIYAGAQNYSSIRSFEKCGFKKVGEVTYLKIFSWSRYKYNGTLPMAAFLI